MNAKLKRRAKAISGTRLLRAGRPSEEEVSRKTTSDALQHPAVMLSLAVCITSTAYLLLILPMFGGAAGAITIAALSGTVATASFLYQYAKEYPKNARKIVERLKEEKIWRDEAERAQICETIQAGFVSVGSRDGAEALAELTTAYEQLQLPMAQRRTTDPLSLSTIQALISETDRRGEVQDEINRKNCQVRLISSWCKDIQ